MNVIGFSKELDAILLDNKIQMVYDLAIPLMDLNIPLFDVTDVINSLSVIKTVLNNMQIEQVPQSYWLNYGIKNNEL